MRQSKSWLGFFAGACISAACMYLADPFLAVGRFRRARNRLRVAPAGDTAPRRSIDAAETIAVAAPLSSVFDFWTRLDVLPQTLTHVREVRATKTDSRYHWQLSISGSAPIEFDATLTRYDPERAIAWRTAADSAVRHAGVVLFEPLGKNATRVLVQFSYAPPRGVAGRAAAALVGDDVRAGVLDYLSRAKAAIEAAVNCCDRARSADRESSRSSRSLPA